MESARKAGTRFVMVLCAAWAVSVATWYLLYPLAGYLRTTIGLAELGWLGWLC